MPKLHLNEKYKAAQARRARRKALARRVPRPMRVGAPYKLKRTLRYASVHDVSWGATLPYNDYIFRANGLFDPDYSGSGHQPRFFDQYMALYDHYTVIGAKIKVSFCNKSTTTPSDPIMCALVLSDNNGTLASSWEDIAEQSDIKKTVIGHPEGGQACRTITKGFSCRKFFSRSNPLDDKDLAGTQSTDPNEQAWFHILTSVGAITADRTVQLQVVVDYVTVFSEPKVPTSS